MKILPPCPKYNFAASADLVPDRPQKRCTQNRSWSRNDSRNRNEISEHVRGDLGRRVGRGVRGGNSVWHVGRLPGLVDSRNF
jgi:hypothetical protein